MRIEPQRLPGVLTIEPTVYGDARGWFSETYREEALAAHGVNTRFVQDNHSHSERGVLRGLHYQLAHPQAKLCRVVRGAVLDVVADARRGSPTFGQWQGIELSAENGRQIYIPAGYAHGFLVLSDVVDFLYKCDDYYFPDDNYGVVWNDPRLAVDWGVTSPTLSDKDAALPQLDDVPPGNLPQHPA